MKLRRVLALGFALLIALPIATSTGCMMMQLRGDDWRSARRDSSGQAPEPAAHAEAVVQVYCARIVQFLHRPNRETDHQLGREVHHDPPAAGIMVRRNGARLASSQNHYTSDSNPKTEALRFM